MIVKKVPQLRRAHQGTPAMMLRVMPLIRKGGAVHSQKRFGICLDLASIMAAMVSMVANPAVWMSV